MRGLAVKDFPALIQNETWVIILTTDDREFYGRVLLDDCTEELNILCDKDTTFIIRVDDTRLIRIWNKEIDKDFEREFEKELRATGALSNSYIDRIDQMLEGDFIINKSMLGNDVQEVSNGNRD